MEGLPSKEQIEAEYPNGPPAPPVFAKLYDDTKIARDQKRKAAEELARHPKIWAERKAKVLDAHGKLVKNNDYVSDPKLVKACPKINYTWRDLEEVTKEKQQEIFGYA